MLHYITEYHHGIKPVGISLACVVPYSPERVEVKVGYMYGTCRRYSEQEREAQYEKEFLHCLRVDRDNMLNVIKKREGNHTLLIRMCRNKETLKIPNPTEHFNNESLAKKWPACPAKLLEN